MYKCKPNLHLTVEPVAGDVAYLPRRLFERLFADFEGGVLGIVLKTNDEFMYATAAPSSEQGTDIYLPPWIATAFEQRTFRDLEVLEFTVEKAEPIAKAALIVVRQCVEMVIDLREELEAFFFDCRYVHANTVLHVGGCEVWIERVVDSEGFEVSVAELGPEVSVDIQRPLDDGGRSAAEAAAEEAAKAAAKPQIPDAATIRAQRLKYFEKNN